MLNFRTRFSINVCWTWLYRMSTSMYIFRTWFPGQVSISGLGIIYIWHTRVPRFSPQGKCLSPRYTTWEFTEWPLVHNSLEPSLSTAMPQPQQTQADNTSHPIHILDSSSRSPPVSLSHQPRLVRECNLHPCPAPLLKWYEKPYRKFWNLN